MPKEAEEPVKSLNALTVRTNQIGFEVGLATLVGSYAEKGINHGKKSTSRNRAS